MSYVDQHARAEHKTKFLVGKSYELTWKLSFNPGMNTSIVKTDDNFCRFYASLYKSSASKSMGIFVGVKDDKPSIYYKQYQGDSESLLGYDSFNYPFDGWYKIYLYSYNSDMIVSFYASRDGDIWMPMKIAIFSSAAESISVGDEITFKFQLDAGGKYYSAAKIGSWKIAEV